MTDQQTNLNQTQFGIEEPILQKPAVDEPPVTEHMPLKKKPRLSKRLWLVGGLLAVLLIAVIVVWLTAGDGAMVEEEALEPSTQQSLTPLEQSLEEIKVLLIKANPTTQELPFPPLNLELRIDDAR
jgi:hypothetical protein